MNHSSSRFVSKCRRRNSSGVSITELIVSSILLASSLAVVVELMALCTVTNSKMFNQFDAQMGAHFAIDRIKRDVRMAAEIKSESNEFSSRKILNSSTLILHIPVFYEAASDDPSSIAMNGFTLPGHCAVVYEVVPDPERSGEFMIVCSTRKSLQNAADEAVTSRSRVDDQIIVKGIVGPMDINNPSALPKVFSYVAKNPIHSDRLDLVIDSVLYDQSVANGLAGVAIDLEMKRGNLGSTLTEFPTDKFVAVHSEVCLRLPFADKGRLDPNLYE